MSTILKALKKLEQEQAAHQKEGPGAIQDFNPRQAVQQAVKLARVRGWGFKMGIAAVVLVTLGAVAYFYILRAPKGRPPASSPAKVMARSQTPARIPRQASPSRPSAKLSKPQTAFLPEAHKAESIDSRLPSKSLDRTAASGPGRVALPPQMDKTHASVGTNAISNRPAASQEPHPTAPGEPQRRAEAAAPPAQFPKQTDPYGAAVRLTDGRLKVQAIAWGPNAEERMAVINNHVLREGQTLETFTILAIEQDAVMVKEGPKIWKVVFGSP